MKQYLDFMQQIRDHGIKKEDRTGTGTLSLFGHQMRFNLAEGFPLLTTKKVHMKSIIHELLWFLQGDTNIAYLKEHGVSIWDAWADEKGDLGPVYGHQWRSWPSGNGPIDPIDQIHNLVEGLKNNPTGRRHIVTAWNPADIEDMALPPCHCLFQFNAEPLSLKDRLAFLSSEELAPSYRTRDRTIEEVMAAFDKEGIPKYRLSCQLYQRSADWFLGVPFNIASYTLLTEMIAQVVNMVPGEFIHTFGDAHIYLNHLNQVDEQLSREPFRLPALQLNRQVKNLFDFTYDDIKIENYDAHPRIPAPVAV